jgi:hypothetical protein
MGRIVPDATDTGHSDIRHSTRPPCVAAPYPAAVTNEPTAEFPAPRASVRAAGIERPAGSVATGTPVGAPDAPGRATTGAPAVATGAPGVGMADAPATQEPPAATPVPPRRRGRWLVAVLAVLLAASLGVGGYLYVTTEAYAERLGWTEQQARAIGADLTLTRSDLDGARAEIDALQAQLTTAQDRITALADEKAQIGDDREAQRQLLDYQARVSEAAGTVASALDRCVQGQDQLIVYLEDADSYDPAQLSQFGSDVEKLCQSASDANKALQSELADR